MHHFRSGGLRRLGQSMLLFLVSLAVARACEVAFSAATLSAALNAQSRWIETVRSLTPFTLTSSYLSDLRPASAGDLIYRPPPSAVTPAMLRHESEASERRTACRVALGFASPGSIPAACAAIGVTDPAQFILRERQAPRRDNAQATAAAAPPVTNEAWRVPAVLVPLAAIVRTATRVTSAGVSASIIAVVQLAAGLLFVLVVTKVVSRTYTAGFNGALTNLVLLPIASVAVGSVLAWATQALMLGALQAFQWATGLAAAAAGASGVAGFCWYCVTKLSEKSVEGVVRSKT